MKITIQKEIDDIMGYISEYQIHAKHLKCSKDGVALAVIETMINKHTIQILEKQNERLRKISPLGTYTALELIQENEKLIDNLNKI